MVRHDRGAAVAIAFLISGRRPAITAFADAAAIGVMGVWDPAMDTASQVLVATLHRRAGRRRHRRLGGGEPARRAPLRPVLDTLQTLPQLVYIIPFIYLMPVSRVPGVVASVLYAVPVVIRLVTSGVRDVRRTRSRRRRRSARRARQVLAKVKIPLARDAIMLGVNQGIIMVLAVVVIGGLVGSGALGDLVARGLQRNEFGEGVVASLAILAFGIALDRVTQRTGAQARGGRRSITMRGLSHGRSMRGARSRWPRCALALASASPRAAARRRRSHGRRRRGGRGAGKDCGKVTINENAWAGSTANVYIAKAVLEDKLGCTVEITKIAEIPASRRWPTARSTRCSRTGSTSTSTRSTSTRPAPSSTGGSLGVEGHIGWFIPKYLMDEHPEFKTWEGLKGKEELFKTAESGSQGMFLGGDPSYVQKDKELIEALDLNLKHVTAGAEPAQVARWTQLYKQKKPVIFYWYTPQYLNQEYDLAEVELPEVSRTARTTPRPAATRSSTARIRRSTNIQKLFTKEFADSVARVRRADQDASHERGPGTGRRANSMETVTDPTWSGLRAQWGGRGWHADEPRRHLERRGSSRPCPPRSANRYVKSKRIPLLQVEAPVASYEPN